MAIKKKARVKVKSAHKKISSRKFWSHTRFSTPNLIIFAAIFAAIGGYLLFSGHAAGSIANVFVSPTGSDTGANCVRFATAQAFPGGTVCATLDKAYHLAQPGDVVEVENGTYPAQTVDTDSSKTSTTDVVFQPAQGASVSLANLDVYGSHITFQNMTIASGGDWQVYQNNDTTFKNINAPAFYSQSTTNLSIIGGSYGPQVNSPSQIGVWPVGTSNTNILIDGVTMHDYTRNDVTVHTECLLIGGPNNVTVRNSKFYNCDIFDLSIGGMNGSPQMNNITVENNFFAAATGGGFFSFGMNYNDGQGVNNLLVRNNSALQEMSLNQTTAPMTNIRVVNNIAPQSSGGCDSAITYSHNVFQGVTCGATDLNVASPGFVNIATNPPDLHLASGSAAIDKGDPANCPATDIDGDTRPQGAACDAGADEYKVVNPACPQGTVYADGCPATSTGTPQYPNMLSGYVTRPPWNVAGADYHVGIPTGTTLTPWRSATIANATINLTNGQISCATPNAAVTVNSIDFTPAAGVSPYIYGYTNNCTWVIKNSQFTCGNSVGNVLADNATVENNNFDQTSCPDTSTFVQGSNIIVKYNWFKHSLQHILESGGPGPIDYQFNLIDDAVAQGTAPVCSSQACHENFQQLTGTGSISADTVKFNATYQHTSGSGNGEGFQFYCNSGPCQVNNPILSNNTMICKAGTGMSNIINGGDATHPGNIVNGTNTNNYFDPSACNPYYANTITLSLHWTSSGNIDMTNGNTINPADNTESGGGGGDTTAPTVSLTAPTAGATVSGASVAVSATASDNVGVSGVQFKLDGANLGSEDTTSPYSTTWNATTAANGSHSLTAVARDAAGNTTTSSAISVTVSGGTSILLGNQSLESQADPISVQQAEAWPFTATGSGNAGSVSLNLDASSTAQGVSVGLYADSSGSPGSLLTTATISAPSNGNWNTANFASNPVVTSGTSYWLSVLGTGTGQVRVRDRAGGSCTAKINALPNNWTSLHDPFGATGGNFTDCPISAYVTAASAAAAPIQGDVNADGHVTISDLSILLSNWNSTTNATCDINSNGTVDIFDLSILLSHYGQ